MTALGVLYVRDPGQPGSYGFCPLRALTGLDCPFCGGLRGTHALLHGDLATALDHNLLLPLYLAAAVTAGWVLLTGRRSQGRWARLLSSRSVAWALVVVTLGFFLARNLPWFPYLDSAAGPG